ncbi:DUF1214 domain-containing protein [Nocardia sp. NPDC059764]|uniref:DUF1214 domain-containing protein n=1 Tax=Nocardia sp. NPDC059764 TaxID=3346939 RepID=UPI00364F4788
MQGKQEVNGWQITRSGIGDYGTDYATRAIIAYAGLGANLPQDAIYPATAVDDKNTQLTSDRPYVLHFPADGIPPVKGFWSLTMYNDRGFFVDNPINRYAVRGEALTKNPDGSVDIHIQRENPGPAKESNWLSAPASGPFNVLLRTYWPDQAVIDGTWNARPSPPPADPPTRRSPDRTHESGWCAPAGSVSASRKERQHMDFGVLLGEAYQSFVQQLHAHLAEHGHVILGASYGYVLRALAESPCTAS